MGRTPSFLSYSVGDQVRVLAAAALLLSLPPVLGAIRFERVRRVLLRASDAAAVAIPGDPAPARIVSATEAADRHLPGSRRCLVRSLTTETLLRLYAFTPDHRIGVTKGADGVVKAHSWLEFDGEILIGELENLSQYEPLPPLNRGTNL
ncbi:lasso peptide biosynthesis B2 protein [Halopiger thermotolerans]